VAGIAAVVLFVGASMLVSLGVFGDSSDHRSGTGVTVPYLDGTGEIELPGHDVDAADPGHPASTGTMAPGTTAPPVLAHRDVTYGTTPCPPVGGTDAHPLSFPGPPANCLDAGKTYGATLQTSAGPIDVTLDTVNTPGTVNDFVFLSRSGYYSESTLFKVDPRKGTVHGGAASEYAAGPGYQLDDEGMFDATSTHGGYKYVTGDLVMARVVGPDNSLSKFFFVVGDGGPEVDPWGTSVVFGHVSGGMDVLRRILATAKPAASGDSFPDPAVTVSRIEISEH
jgi:cyclophilin family peptidyl-prolyl cis-trans isomerase